MSDLDGKLEAIRAELDEVDRRLVALISDRARLAQKVGEIKAAAGLRVYAPDRERQVLDRVCGMNDGPIEDGALRTIYRELMSASLALERSPRIAILGPPGSFSHLAGRRKFGLSVEFEIVTSIAEVFDAIEYGHAEFALAPVENSVAGGVGETLDALIERDVKVCGEVNLAVHHHLLGHGPIEKIEKVCSKQEVFAQCHKYLAAMGWSGKTVAVGSTSAAAKLAKEDATVAAVASDLAAELFELPRLAEYVEDDPGNVTRFLIISTASPKPTGADRTSIVFAVGHEAGKLVEVLDQFRVAGINMTRIESRPDRQKRWGYYFFVDVEGHADAPALAEQLKATGLQCSFWKVLGSYPVAEEVL